MPGKAQEMKEIRHYLYKKAFTSGENWDILYEKAPMTVQKGVILYEKALTSVQKGVILYSKDIRTVQEGASLIGYLVQNFEWRPTCREKYRGRIWNTGRVTS